MINPSAKWIWINSSPEVNEYALFEEGFAYEGEKAVFSIAAETDYVLFVNGVLAGQGQFAGYPFEKYCDELDITPLCKQGENSFSLTVRYEGVNSATHINDGPGVIYTLDIDGKTALCSSEATLACPDHRYIQHQDRWITPQLGLTSGMCCGVKSDKHPCTVIDKTRNILPRPVKKAELGQFIPALPVEGKEGVYDLGREESGYLRIRVKAASPCEFKVTYSEHMESGEVRHIIGSRDFSLDFEVCEGESEFTQYFIKVASRYLHAILPEGVEVLSIGLIPLLYPLTEKPTELEGLDRAIYDTCVRTLRLCMNLHYEDCPWREQALYVLDSRNQMLCGYYAFEQTEFQRANLVFISKGARPDGLLELTYPAVNTPAIPFFSVMYPVAVWEYVKHTGDRTILPEVMGRMLAIMENFRSRIEENGLIAEFEAPYWNFYEWTDGSSGSLSGRDRTPQKQFHLIISCAFVYSAERFKELCEMEGVDFGVDTDAIKAAIKREFFNPESGLFSLSTLAPERSSQLGNAFALLIGLGDERTLEALKNDNTLIPATLSMLAYVYDALLLRDENGRDYVLNDIREKYGYMLGKGATSFWETIDGASAFNDAGSLCHGWSALPIYYYRLLADS
ncbi:MAG: hypothetical protein IKM04_00670 [Clostridia bacterium]|nr:hypothetical protein [Clostridia bacterium]